MISSDRCFLVALLLNCLLINGSAAGHEHSTSPEESDRQATINFRRRTFWAHEPQDKTPGSDISLSKQENNSGSLMRSAKREPDTTPQNLDKRMKDIEQILKQNEAAILAKTQILDEKLNILKQNISKIEEHGVARAIRQTDVQNVNDSEISDSDKLTAMATLLVSNAAKINELEYELKMNISALLATTNNLVTRVERLRRLQAKAASRGNVISLAASPANADMDESGVAHCNAGAPTTNGIIKLQVPNYAAFYALCEDRFQNGGWTVIQNRHYGDVNFQRDWAEYKTGFGNLAGDFFLGLDKIHALTTHMLHELAIILVDHDNVSHTARYNLFAIGNEQESYNLKLLGAYNGTAGDAFSYHAGSKFSTFDNDNDGCLECNCAAAHLGGWWYNWCDMSNLNGKYHKTDYENVPTYQGVYWHHFHGPNYSLRSVRMMIRPLTTEEYRR